MPGLQNNKSTLDFLGTLGTTDKGDVGLSNVARGLVDLAQFLIEEATENLQKNGNIATGETASSMKIVNADLNAPVMSLDVEILSTYKFLDQGVKGTEGGQGKYQFKTKKPSRKMVAAILRWMRKRAAGGRIKYRAVSKNEKKNQRIRKTLNSAQDRKSLAYAVATSIKKRGIKRTLFFSKAVRDTQKAQGKFLAEGLKLDIIESLKTN